MYTLAQLRRRIEDLVKKIRELTQRKTDLQKILPSAQRIQGQFENAVRSSQNRLDALAGLGLSSALLEDIISPVRMAPDCSGILSAVKSGIDDTDAEIDDCNREKARYKSEETRLEQEELEKEMAQV